MPNNKMLKLGKNYIEKDKFHSLKEPIGIIDVDIEDIIFIAYVNHSHDDINPLHSKFTKLNGSRTAMVKIVLFIVFAFF